MNSPGGCSCVLVEFELQILKCTQLGFFAVNTHVTNFEMHTTHIVDCTCRLLLIFVRACSHVGGVLK